MRKFVLNGILAVGVCIFFSSAMIQRVCDVSMDSGNTTYDVTFFSEGNNCCSASPGVASVTKTKCKSFLGFSYGCTTEEYYIPSYDGAALYSSQNGCIDIV